MMVLESLINPTRAEHRPWVLFFLGFVYATVGLFLGLWIFEEYASMIMIFLTTMAAIPLVFSTIDLEEKKDEDLYGEKTLLKEHGKALSVFLFLFLGATFAFTVWYVVLPADITNVLFTSQSKTIGNLNQQLTGNATNEFPLFAKIFMNNLKVLIFCILFSFIYGMGAIFILVWNASVIAAALGNFIKSHIAQYALSHGFSQVGSYFYAVSLSFTRYMIHGIPEIIAYIIAGLAGGIISVAVIRHNIGSKKFYHVLLDAMDLLLVSVGILIIAGLMEVFLTPLLI